MSDTLLALFLALGTTCFLFGLQSIIFLPLSFIFAVRRRRKSVLDNPLVSVIVPAYNEGEVIANCVDSIMASDYSNFEVILVDDGSTDETLEVMREYETNEDIRVISKVNGGKASALNAGIEATRGEILFCVDGDTIFKKDTIRQALDGFTSPDVGAVCGHDSPVNLNNWQLKLFNLQNHVGTGFVRRALSLINSLPIVSGNIGAFRMDVIDEVGGFRNNFIGEDLELTFRIHKAGYKVVFQPWAQVYTESPATLGALWKQRVRWGRGFIQTMRIHKDMILNPKYGSFGIFLGINGLSMIAIPILQFFSILLLPALILTDNSPVSLNALGIMGYCGLFFTLFVGTYSIILDKSYKDLKYLPAAFLWIGYSLIIDLVVIRSVYLEIRGTEAAWNKFDRTGVISKSDTPLKLGLQGGPKGLGRQIPAFAAVGVFILFLLGVGFSTKLPTSMIRETASVETAPLMDFSHVSALPVQGTRAIAIHFEQYENWKDGYRAVLDASHININTVGVGAGRLDWNYFRWAGHRDWWSSDLRGSSDDFLKTTAEALGAQGYKVVAIVDMFAPQYIKEHPEVAASNFHGTKSEREVCLAELVDGAFGIEMLEMIAYIARNYPVNAINITELSYESYCYDERCKQRFLQFSGQSDWPKRWLRGGVNVDEPALIDWRSNEVARFVRKAAQVAHAYDTELYIDVEVSWDDFSDHSREKGQDYTKLLRYADKLVIWDYFNLAGERPEYSEDLAAYLRGRFPEERIIMSVGLWEEDGSTLPPDDMGLALASSVKGGIRNFWVTPSHMFSADHWNVLKQIYGIRPSEQ